MAEKTSKIPECLTDTKLIFFKYEENFTSRNSVRLQVDPTPYILYWRYKDYKVFNTKELAHERNYVYLERIYDVRVGKPTDFDLVLHEKNFEKNFLTVVSGESITSLEFTHFVCLDNDEKKLQNFATALFQLSQRVRREEHGLLYHFRKKLAPKMYAAFTPRCLEEELVYFCFLGDRGSGGLVFWVSRPPSAIFGENNEKVRNQEVKTVRRSIIMTRFGEFSKNFQFSWRDPKI
ncbi:unnamed protein product [Caenorhabditis brenneri]